MSSTPLRLVASLKPVWRPLGMRGLRTGPALRAGAVVKSDATDGIVESGGDVKDIQWSNPRANLDKVSDDVLYALPPPLAPPFPETAQEASRRFWRSWAPGIATAVVIAVWYTRRKLRREWRGHLEAVAPGVVAPLESIGFIPTIDAVNDFDTGRLFERIALRLAPAGGSVPQEVAADVITKLGGDSGAAAALGALPLDDFVAEATRLTRDVKPARLFFSAQQEFGVVALSPVVEEALFNVYSTVCTDKNSQSFTPDDISSLADHLGVGISTADAVSFLASAQAAPPTGVKNLRPIFEGVHISAEEFLNFMSDLLYGVTDEAVLKHCRVFHMLRNL